MKYLKFGLMAAVGGFLLASPAAAATHEWRGGGFITPLTQGCADDGWSGPEYASARFRPKGLGDNGPNERISFFHPLFFATSYVRENAKFAKSFKPVIQGGVGSGPYIQPTGAKLKATKTPSNVKAGTETVRLVGEIKNYGAAPNCTMAFDVTLTKRP